MEACKFVTQFRLPCGEVFRAMPSAVGESKRSSDIPSDEGHRQISGRGIQSEFQGVALCWSN